MIGPGSRVDKYEVVAPLRSGGMADLFLARHEGPGGFERIVALKVIHTRFAKDRDFVDMFLDEARLAARIDHPNVVHIESLGEHDGTYYMVMEYLHGASLGELLGALAGVRRRLTPEVAVSIALDLAAGLHAAHEVRGEDGKRLGVVHRDVSPQNGLLTTHGDVQLIDFGIAKARGRLHVTQEQRMKGKLAYMPPEQVVGDPLDRRADIYALGVVLWELLTQQRLFHAERETDLIPLVRAGAKRSPGEVVSGVSPELDEAVMEALAPHRDDRPATARDFRRRLREACPGADSVDPPERAGLLLALLGGALSDRANELGAGAVATAFDTVELATEPLRCLEKLTLQADSLAPGRPSATPTAADSPSAKVLVAAPSPMVAEESRVELPARRISPWLVLSSLALGAIFTVGVLYLFAGGAEPSAAPAAEPAAVAAPVSLASLPGSTLPTPVAPDANAPRDAGVDEGVADADSEAPAASPPSDRAPAPRPSRRRRSRPVFETFDEY